LTILLLFLDLRSNPVDTYSQSAESIFFVISPKSAPSSTHIRRYSLEEV
jgi:hypothetical protein